MGQITDRLKALVKTLYNFSFDPPLKTGEDIEVVSEAVTDKKYELLAKFLFVESIPANVTLGIRFNHLTNHRYPVTAGMKFYGDIVRIYVTVTVVGTVTPPSILAYDTNVIIDADSTRINVDQDNFGVSNAIVMVSPADSVTAVIDPVSGATYQYNNPNEGNLNPIGAPSFGPVYAHQEFTNPGANPELILNVDGRPNVEIFVRSITPIASFEVYSFESPTFGAGYYRLVGTFKTAPITGEYKGIFLNAYRYVRVVLLETAPPNGTSLLEISASR